MSLDISAWFRGIIETMITKSITISSLCLTLLFSQAIQADARTQAKRIFDRLTGAIPTETVLTAMEDSILNDDATGAEAADIAMLDPAFYNITLKNFAAPWTNEEETVFAPLNDYSATVIGMIRDDIDFRELLFGNFIYTGAGSLGLTGYSNSNNNHYTELEALGPNTGDLSNSSILTQQAQSSVIGIPAAATAGIMTTRAAAKSFFYLGTNRAMFRFTVLNHLCTDLEPIKDNTRPSDRVRQDVSRSPGGDSRIFLNGCVSCHAGMDGLAGAYAYYDLQYSGDKDTDVATFENSAQMTFTDGDVTSKHFNNDTNFNPGHITADDSWINYWRNGPNSLLGWNGGYPGFTTDDKGNAVGNGAKTMGMELAYSDAFAQCQVKKAFQTVCLRDPEDYTADRTEVGNIISDIQSNSGVVNMKNVFRDVAAYCKGN